jgi:hypothetical protein
MGYRLGTRAVMLAASLLLSGTGPGCGSSSGSVSPAHSASFFPVRGTADGGGPAKVLEWLYRINGAKAVAYSATPGSSIQYADDSVVIMDGAVLTRSIEGLLSSTSGGPTGSVASTITDHLSGDAPAIMVERDIYARATLNLAGPASSSYVAIVYEFGATPMATFFDRDDLDLLAIGFSETQQATGTATGSVSAITGTSTQTEPVSATVMITQSWTLSEQLPTFQVLGRDYANVVKIDSVTSVVESTAGMMVETSSTTWLAKGIGLIRGEETIAQSGGTDTVASELLDTNLVAP